MAVRQIMVTELTCFHDNDSEGHPCADYFEGPNAAPVGTIGFYFGEGLACLMCKGKDRPMHVHVYKVNHLTSKKEEESEEW